MSPVAVIGLEIEARAYIVFAVAGIRFSRLAQPMASSHRIRPSFAMATATDGEPTASTIRCIAARTEANGSEDCADAGGASPTTASNSEGTRCMG